MDLNEKKARPIRKYVRDIPPKLEEIVEKAMEKNFADRYPNCKLLSKDLALFFNQRTDKASPRTIFKIFSCVLLIFIILGCFLLKEINTKNQSKEKIVKESKIEKLNRLILLAERKKAQEAKKQLCLQLYREYKKQNNFPEALRTLKRISKPTTAIPRQNCKSLP